MDVLFEAATALASDTATEQLNDAADGDGHDFNLSILCCLPKKPRGTDPNLGDFFLPEDTRPLSIVNTDDRIIANACRFRWEPIFNSWVPEYQSGFLRGRSMLSNVVDIDFEAMRSAWSTNTVL